MIRRRCRAIVVSDAGEDGATTFEDLGNAVRRAEIDFGVRVRFKSLEIKGKTEADGRSWAVGSIVYPEAPQNEGFILYLKPCRDDRAPVSVRSYAALNSKFPHETTQDQWFGETQFEAYRALGEHIVDSIAPSRTYSSVREFVADVEGQVKRVNARSAAGQSRLPPKKYMPIKFQVPPRRGRPYPWTGPNGDGRHNQH